MHYRKTLTLALAAMLLGLMGCSGGGGTRVSGPPRSLPNPFYVFHFIMESLTPAQQVELAQQTGYDGITYLGPGDRAVLGQIEAYQSVPLVQQGKARFGALFWSLNIDAPEPFDPALLEDICRKLAGTGTLLWLQVRSTAGAKPSAENDRTAAAAIQRFADIARQHQVTVALYPHDGDYMASAEHALRLIRLAQRDAGTDNLKLSLHLCHELRAGNGERMPEVIRQTLPYIAIASINGANKAVNPGSPDWQDAIKVLGEGDYDVQSFLNALVKAGYRGPIVLHTFGLTGDPREVLSRSFRTWEQMALTASR